MGFLLSLVCVAWKTLSLNPFSSFLSVVLYFLSERRVFDIDSNHSIYYKSGYKPHLFFCPATHQLAHFGDFHKFEERHEETQRYRNHNFIS